MIGIMPPPGVVRVAVVGSRKYRHLDRVTKVVHTLPDYVQVVSGGAPGPDRVAAKAALDGGFPPLVLRPRWRQPDGTLDMRAGFARNTTIVEATVGVLAFWDGMSRGTNDTVSKAIERGKLTAVFDDQDDADHFCWSTSEWWLDPLRYV